MSMWEIEALGEEAVRLIDQSDLAASDKRDFIMTSYAEISAWDTSSIHFRSLNILERNHLFLAILPDQHPDYATRKDEINAFIADGASWLNDPETGQAEAIYTSPGGDTEKAFWCDPSMTLWEKAGRIGFLSQEQAQPIRRRSKAEWIKILIFEANKLDDRKTAAGLIKMFHGFMAFDADTIDRNDKDLQAILGMAGLGPALKAPVHETQDWIEKRFDARDALKYAKGDGIEKLEWWVSPYQQV